MDHLPGGRRGRAGIRVMRGGAAGEDCAERRDNDEQEVECKWSVIKRNPPQKSPRGGDHVVASDLTKFSSSPSLPPSCPPSLSPSGLSDVCNL